MISDEMGNSSTVSFTVYVNSTAKESKLKTNKVYILTWDSQVEQAIKAVNKIYPSYTKNIEVIKYEVGGGSVPGMWVQRLTTKEPDLEMCEVAIRSVEAVIDWRAYQDAMKRGEIED